MNPNAEYYVRHLVDELRDDQDYIEAISILQARLSARLHSRIAAPAGAPPAHPNLYNADNLVMIVDESGTIISANRALERVASQSPLVGSPAWSLFPKGKDAEIFRSRVCAFLAGRAEPQFESPFSLPNGDARAILWSMDRWSGDNDSGGLTVIAGMEINPRPRIERALQSMVNAETPDALLRAFLDPLLGGTAYSANIAYMDDPRSPHWIEVVAALQSTGHAPNMSPIGRRFDFSERTQFVVDTVRHHLVFSVPDTDVRPSVLSEADQAVIRKIGARSAVFVLLTPPNRAWAGLVAIYWSEPRELLSEEEHYFEVVAPHLAVALENRYLFRRTRDALKLTEALYTASTRLVTAAHDQDVLGAVFEHASANGAVQAGLHMITLDASGSPEWSELLAEIPVQQDNGQIGKLYYLPDYPFSWTWLTQATEPLFIEDLEQATHIDPRTLDELQKIGVRAAVFMPLRVTDSFYASLAIRWTVPTTFDDLERRFYAALVMQVAAALRARLLSKQLRQMNNRLVKHSAELKDINAQLEAFTYSVSHDLRAPLRAVDGFARALHEEFGASLDTTAQHYIERIRANADHMNALITDLLALSRLGQHTLQLKQLQPADIARRAFSEIYLPKHQDSAVITIGDLPSCYADPTLLRQVFVNLLDNALKFTRPGAPPQIEVGCTTREDGQPVYFVRDHGIGFEMDYADRLFGVFQRLPNAKAFEGTGVGLAIVQRIIQLHNGQVWAHSAPNQGTTFYFTVGMRETGERDG